MLYTIRHVTRYEYPREVRESVMEVRKHPQSNAFQRCVQFQLKVDPEVRVFSYTDHLGNIVHHFDIPWSHRTLAMTAEAVVDVKPQAEREGYPPDPRGTWEELDELVAQKDFYEMLLPSRYVQPSSLLEDLCQELRAQRRATPFHLAQELTQSVHHSFRYDREITKVDSPVDQAIESRCGVCQDFAHVLLGLLRHVGIPSRYVSGYLFRAPHSANGPLGRSSHAWVEALIPRAGWVGLDPAFGTMSDERHLYTCVGRDYADIPPTRGLYRGEGPGKLSFAVQVHLPEEPIEEDRFRPLT